MMRKSSATGSLGRATGRSRRGGRDTNAKHSTSINAIISPKSSGTDYWATLAEVADIAATHATLMRDLFRINAALEALEKEGAWKL